MKIKYKKLIVSLTMGVLCIGFMTFSMMEPSHLLPSFHQSKSSVSRQDVSSKNTKTEADTTDTEAETVTIKENEVQTSIEELIQKYMKAKQDVDMDTISQCVTDVDNVNEKKLLSWAEYIEDTKNISCTIIAGPTDGTYLVYVYYEYKFFEIDTLAPGLSFFYITTNEEGQLLIYLDKLDGDTQDYIAAENNSDMVKKLCDSVEEKYAQAVQSDEKLKNLYEMFEGSGEEE